MDRNKVKGYINIAHKAGYLILGGENLDGYNKKLYLALVDSAAGKNTLKIAERLREKCEVVTVENLGELVSIEKCKIVGIKNKNLSEIIQKLIEERSI